MPVFAISLAVVAVVFSLVFAPFGLVTWTLAVAAIILGWRAARRRPDELRTGSRPWASVAKWSGVVALVVSLALGSTAVGPMVWVWRLAHEQPFVKTDVLVAGYGGSYQRGQWIETAGTFSYSSIKVADEHFGWPTVELHENVLCVMLPGDHNWREGDRVAMRGKIAGSDLRGLASERRVVILEPCLAWTE